MARILDTLHYFGEYFVKCDTEDGFYYEIGDENLDYDLWYDLNTGPAPARNVTKVSNNTETASDVLGLTSAALSSIYLNMNEFDATNAQKYLDKAKKLYEMGKVNPAIGYKDGVYKSTSYYDDMAWAAVWLYEADKNNTVYLNEAENFLMQAENAGEAIYKDQRTMYWDNMYLPVFIKLYDITSNEKYKKAVEFNLEYWRSNIASTQGGSNIWLMMGR